MTHAIAVPTKTVARRGVFPVTRAALLAALALSFVPPPVAYAGSRKPVTEAYLLVLYRYPNQPHKVHDQTPFEAEAYLDNDASMHFREISHGAVSLDITVHPEIVTLGLTSAELRAKGLDKPRGQEVICAVEDRDPCSPDNLTLGPRGVDLTPFLVKGRLRLIVVGSSKGGSRRSYDMHGLGRSKVGVELMSWGMDDSRGESGSYAAGWKVGAEEMAHHIVTVHDYYSDVRHRRPIWTRPDGAAAERDHATGWAKTEWSWIHPTPWDKRVRRLETSIDKPSYWRLGQELQAVKEVLGGGPERDREFTLRPAEITPDRFAGDECQGILLPFDGADLAAPDKRSTKRSEKDAPYHGYVLEYRRRIGADEPILAEGVVMWIVRDKKRADGRLGSEYGDFMHHKARAMVMARDPLDLKTAPFGPGDRFVDAARGIEVEVLADQADPRYGLRVRVRRQAERAPDVAVERFVVVDPGAKAPLRFDVELSSTVDVRGVRMAVQMRVDRGEKAGKWMLVRYGIVNVDAGPRRPTAFPYPKRFKDVWSGDRRDTKPMARLRQALTAGGEVRVDWRLLVWHEDDLNRDNDTSVFTSTFKAPLSF